MFPQLDLHRHIYFVPSRSISLYTTSCIVLHDRYICFNHLKLKWTINNQVKWTVLMWHSKLKVDATAVEVGAVILKNESVNDPPGIYFDIYLCLPVVVVFTDNNLLSQKNIQTKSHEMKLCKTRRLKTDMADLVPLNMTTPSRDSL